MSRRNTELRWPIYSPRPPILLRSQDSECIGSERTAVLGPGPRYSPSPSNSCCRSAISTLSQGSSTLTAAASSQATRTLPMTTTAAQGTISAPSARRSTSHHRLCCLRLRCSQPRSINPTAGPLFYVPRTFPTAFILFSRRGRLPTPSESMTKDLGS